MKLPVIKQINLDENFRLDFYEHFSSLILDEENNLKEEVKKELIFWTSFDSSFKFQIALEGTQFLLGVDNKDKVLRLCNVKMANEIFLLDNFNGEKNKAYKAFKNHVTKVMKVRIGDFPGVSRIITKRYNLDTHAQIDTEEVSKMTETITKKLLVYINGYSPVFFEKISDFALGLTANYALLRIHLLKFLAILPSLDHDDEGTEVKRTLKEALRRLIVDSKKAEELGLKGDRQPLPSQLVLLFYFTLLIVKVFPAKPLAAIVRFKVRFMARRFIAGETIETAQKNFSTIFKSGRDVTLDQLGELVVSEEEADNYMNEVLKLVNGFSMHISPGRRNKAGILRAHVSIKVSALCSDFRPEAFNYTYSLVAPRLIKILKAGMEQQVFINIDAEHYHYRDIVFEVYKKALLDTPELKDYADTGIVVQAYLRDCYEHLQDIIDLAKQRGHNMPIRLVKGAYWDAETVEAEAHAHNAPEFLNKEETDINFRQMIDETFKAFPHIKLCLASHNFSDHAFASALRETKYSDIDEIEHQCLHMTYEALSTAMAKMGWAVRNYVPIGSLIVGMAYLVRRIMENSSQVGVLTIMRSHKKNAKLMAPNDIYAKHHEEGLLNLDSTITNIFGDFSNCPPLKTYLEKELKYFRRDFEKFELGKDYESDFKLSGEVENVLSPSDGKSVVGKITFATLDDAQKALDTVDKSFYDGEWSSYSWQKRASIMAHAAEIMYMRRNYYSALIMHESGKAISEALADVDEAIDFLNYYIRRLQEVGPSRDIDARGPFAIIAPWNFPMAIPCGMTASALLTGSSVILKPAEQTPLITCELVNLFHEVGVPKDALIHLPGVGETVGQKLVEDERIAGVIFTGSKPVGVHIAKVCSQRLYHNRETQKTYPVKVITEMGGKNAVIVTNNAELDETVDGILYSAFAHAGQKCSAASRVLVDREVKDKLIARLKQAALDINVGPATDFASYINPLVSQEEKDRLITQVKQACEEAHKYGGKVHVNRSEEDLPGYCVGPTVIELPKSRAYDPESFACRELFAPVVHILPYDDHDDALELFNSVEYGLTGGIFSQSQDDIDYLSKEMLVGSNYINRGITGARVAIEPFGGFKMSGTGPKAGGEDYLRSLFVRPSDEDISESFYEEGGNDSPVISRSSRSDHFIRREKILGAIDEILGNFGPLFPGTFGGQRHNIIELKKWFEVEYLELLNHGRNNRYIPGQINYSVFDANKDRALYLSLNKDINMQTFFAVLMSLAAGTGVTVLCSNKASYQWWNFLIDILKKNRFSKKNIDCYFVNKDKMHELLKENFDVVICDGDEENIREFNKIQGEYNGQSVMTTFITPLEDFINCSYFDLFHLFSCERSYAVNIMRHGAPMELDQ
ncbi:proline dehydrogenase family protein [Halobacteriovorax sp. YZS-1-1]|uniref:proline dehydrogenase family protein n=1 Tax=unclassified Halobacteriovorax TaxID=2639665 RepID=UPI00399AB63A